jgi:tetratricopeptide (TPR) repeat protein
LAQPLKIFISSPGDVDDERRRAALVISRLKREFARFFDVSAVLWEYEPMLSSGHFQDIIDPPSTADIVVVILWSRLGTPLPPKTATREYQSLDGRAPVTGTEWEYEQALAARRRHGSVPDLLVYRKATKGLAQFDRVEQLDDIRRQWEALQGFWQRYFEEPDGRFKAAFNRFTSLDEFETQLEQHLRELLKRRLPPGPAARVARKDGVEWWSGSPYRGLQAFDEEHAAVFFGRERAEREITEALVRRASEGAAFMLVLGASGSGKSSLVRAGILPDLTAPGVVDRAAVWRRAIIHPADLLPDPFAGLAAALLREGALPELAAGGYGEAELAAQLSAGVALSLVPIRAALQRAAGPADAAGVREARLVIVLDQLEALFTAADFTDEMRRAIDDAMAKLARSRLVWIIATLRSDFFHRMTELPALSALAAGLGQYQLAPPTPTELELIVTRPAEVAGLAFEIGEDGVSLASTIREAAARDPASLPLLSFVLDELYRRDVEMRQTNVLTYASYRELGGLEGAIARHADVLIEALPPELRAALPALLLALVEIDETKGTATARTVAQASLAGPEQIELANRLVAARLVIADDAGAGQTLRIAHEALLVHWPLLARLIADHRDFLIIRRRLQGDAANWERRGRRGDLLLPPGLRLAEAEDALAHRRADLDPAIVAYAEASIAAERERAEAAERAREEALLRDLRRSRLFAGIVSALLVVALIVGFIAWRERGIAAAALAEAEANDKRVLDQATGSIQLLKDKYDEGRIPTQILQALVTQSLDTVKGLVETAKDRPGAGDTKEVIAARAQLLDAVSVIQLSVGDYAALESARDENALVDRLVGADAGNAEWRRLWAYARGRLSDVLYWQCDCAKAAVEARGAVDETAKLLAAYPTDDFLHDRLLTDYETIGDSMRVLGDLDAADKAYASWVADAEAAVARQPGVARWQADLAFGYERLGDQLMARGKPEAAEAEYQAYLKLSTDLVAESPQSGGYIAALAQSHERLGDAALARKDRPRARDEYREYLKLATELSNIDSANFGYGQHVATARQRIGDALLDAGDYAGAAREFQTYLAMSQDRLARNRSNNISIYDVVVALQKAGDVARARGDLDDALAKYQESLKYALELAGKKCENGAWDKALAMAHQRIGAILKAKGDADGARAQFAQCAARAVKPTVWSPQTLQPRDVTEECRKEAG